MQNPRYAIPLKCLPLEDRIDALFFYWRCIGAPANPPAPPETRWFPPRNLLIEGSREDWPILPEPEYIRSRNAAARSLPGTRTLVGLTGGPLGAEAVYENVATDDEPANKKKKPNEN